MERPDYVAFMRGEVKRKVRYIVQWQEWSGEWNDEKKFPDLHSARAFLSPFRRNMWLPCPARIVRRETVVTETHVK